MDSIFLLFLGGLRLHWYLNFRQFSTLFHSPFHVFRLTFNYFPQTIWLMLILGTKNVVNPTSRAQVENWNRERKIIFPIALEKCFSCASSIACRCWCAHVLIMLKIKWEVAFKLRVRRSPPLIYLPIFFLFIYSTKSSACNFFFIVSLGLFIDAKTSSGVGIILLWGRFWDCFYKEGESDYVFARFNRRFVLVK